MNLLERLQSYGLSLRREAGTHGGEYAGECPFCGGHDRFRVWPLEGDGGRYWCRGCGKSGDAIQYLRDKNGMSFKGACEVVGREVVSGNRLPSPTIWTPKQSIAPADLWQTKAGLFLDWTEKRLWSDDGPRAMEYLRERGLRDETIRTFRLGWNPKDFYRVRQEWGLPEEQNDRGRSKKLFLPAGLVIPKMTGRQVERLRIRRPEGEQRYCVIPGSTMGPLFAGERSERVMVVESELDAILLHQEAGDLVQVIALGSASARPDQEAVRILRDAETILLSLDNDAAGAKESWRWWKEHFPNSRRWPVINGKDPTEAYQNGLPLRNWVLAGIEPKSGTTRTVARKSVHGMPCIIFDTQTPSDCESTTLPDPNAGWVALAESGADPESTDDETEWPFLSACKILREAQGLRALNARRDGYRRWWSESLPEAAMLVLDNLFSSLRGNDGVTN